MQTLERADIESITFGGHDCGVTQVRGYLNYDMSDPRSYAPHGIPSVARPWVDTAVKSVDFERVFFDIHPNSYADFGCNSILRV